MRQPDRIIRFNTVRARTGLSRSTIYRKIAEGTFPAQLKISTNGAGWRESDINRWIADPAGWRLTPASAGGSHLAGRLGSAEAYAVVPAEVDAVAAGDAVDVMLLD